MVWKATVLHHPIWGKAYPDFANIALNFLPILLDHKFDLYLNGHEHVISYAHYAYDQVPLESFHHVMSNYLEAQMETDYRSESVLNDYKCLDGKESFFGRDPQERTLRVKKGEALH